MPHTITALCSLQGNHKQNNKLLRVDGANGSHQERCAAAVDERHSACQMKVPAAQ
jgi:hypothetical protein